MYKILRLYSVFILFASLFLIQACAEQESYKSSDTAITSEMVKQAQEVWISGLVAIGEANMQGEDPKETARQVLNQYYDYDGAGVLFKPTLTHGDQTFRFTKEGALAYFVGGNENYPDDSGFALSNYVEGTSTVENVIIQGNIAIAMGKITIVSEAGNSVTVDKTFAYRMDDQGQLRIITHHSSLPYSP